MGNIVIASDHSGIALKSFLLEKLNEAGYAVNDFGTNTTDSVDYPDIASKACAEVLQNNAECAILICGTGIGISISANKIEGMRAALVSDAYSAKMAKKHNNANAICLGARTIGLDLALDIVLAYLNSEFEGGRHSRRIQKIMDLENSDQSFCM